MPRQYTPRACLYCDEQFFASPSAVAQGKAKYCSRSCRAKHKTGESHNNWRGGRGLTYNGYVRINVGPRTRMLEHRWVMEQHLGRKLTAREQVHHRNGDKTDNRVENLQLLDIAEHTSIHHKCHQWSRKHVACVECGTTKRQHCGYGLCSTCHSRQYKAARMTKQR